METYFTKLHKKILQSSIWNQPGDICKVWITLLALADYEGEIQGSIGGIAHTARVTTSVVRTALDVFMSADEDSSDPEHQGRRLEAITGGWRLLNFRKYRVDPRRERKKERDRLRQKRSRSTKPPKPAAPSEPSAPSAKRFTQPTLDEVTLRCRELGLSDAEGMKFFAYYESKGWKVGKAPMKNWHAALTGWKTRCDERPSGHGTHPGLRGTSTPSDSEF